MSFVGPAGIELLKMLAEAEIIELTAIDQDYIRSFWQTSDPLQLDMVWRLHPEVYRTNVFSHHPPANDITNFCGPRTEGIHGWPALAKSKYCLPAYIPELERLDREIIEVNPNLVIALGNTPLWALCRTTGIGKLRGTTRYATGMAEGYKVLPTYHPAAVIRQWELRSTTVIDLMKAKREAEYPDVRRPPRQIWIEPAIDDIIRFRDEHIVGCDRLSVDIETSGNQVTCIGLAPSHQLALVIPFVDDRRKGRSYWSTARDEVTVWQIIIAILRDRGIRKTFQNGLYDIAFLWRSMGVQVYGADEDTLLLHHALQPESLKSLGFLGSIYCAETAWKIMRTKTGTIKRDN